MELIEVRSNQHQYEPLETELLALIVRNAKKYSPGVDFVTNPDKMSVEMDNPLILITAKKITSHNELSPILSEVAKQGQPLLIIAEDFEGEGLPTLVLNKSWMPIDSTTVKDALCSVMSERATFLLTPDYKVQVDKTTIDQFDFQNWMALPVADGERYLRSSYGPVKIPEIMLLTEYNRVPVRKVVFCRRTLWLRDGKNCQYCGKKPPIDELTIDHIVPKSKGGQTTFENCVLCCIACNLRKGSNTLEHADMQLRHHKRLADGTVKIVFYNKPKCPMWNPLYALRRRSFPVSWGAFLKHFDETLYWEVGLET